MSMRKITVFGIESLIKDFLFKERENSSNQFPSGNEKDHGFRYREFDKGFSF